MNTDPVTVELLGRKHAVRVPDFATCEAILVEYNACVGHNRPMQLAWLCAAVLGVTTRIGGESGADLAAFRYDLLAYGQKVYAYIRNKDRKVTGNVLYQSVTPILRMVGDAFVSEAEVEEAEKN